jgi:hypothetical protein
MVYVTLNPSGEGLAGLSSAHVRRSVVLNTTELREVLTDIDSYMDRLLLDREVVIPRLGLERLRPPATVLPRDLRELLRELLRSGLTDDGWDHSDSGPLTRAVLGRAAHKGIEMEAAVAKVAVDYLTCRTTLAYTTDGFAANIEHRLGSGPLQPDVTAAQEQLELVAARRHARRLARKLDDDKLVEARAQLDGMLLETIRQLNGRSLKQSSPVHRRDAHALREVLLRVRADVRAAQAWEALHDGETRALEPMRRAAELLAQIEHEQTTRRAISQDLRPIQQSRSSPLALLRDMAGNIKAALPSAHGAELESLYEQSQQLIQAPRPMSSAEQQRHIQALQREQIQRAQGLEAAGQLQERARRFSPYG